MTPSHPAARADDHGRAARPAWAEPAAAVLMAVAGGGLALWAGGQEWNSVSVPRPAPLPPTVHRTSGAEVAPWLPALAVVALAGGLALLAARRVGRVVVSCVLGAAALGLVVAAGTGLLGGTGPARVDARWPALSIVGGILVGASGAVALVRGPRWGRMGARYEPPAARLPGSGQDPAGVWDALDRGDDPTTRD